MLRVYTSILLITVIIGTCVGVVTINMSVRTSINGITSVVGTFVVVGTSGVFLCTLTRVWVTLVIHTVIADANADLRRVDTTTDRAASVIGTFIVIVTDSWFFYTAIF